MRIYTARGDGGDTDLLGERVAKDDPRIELLGSLDESTSAIGLARAHAALPETGTRLIGTQRDLYGIMAELSFSLGISSPLEPFPESRVEWLESEIAAVQATVELPREFVLPGESVPGAALDVARTVVRRAEREAVTLFRAQRIANPQVIRYLNRLSSLLFMLARAEDIAVGQGIRLARTRPRNPDRA